MQQTDSARRWPHLLLFLKKVTNAAPMEELDGALQWELRAVEERVHTAPPMLSICCILPFPL